MSQFYDKYRNLFEEDHDQFTSKRPFVNQDNIRQRVITANILSTPPIKQNYNPIIQPQQQWNPPAIHNQPQQRNPPAIQQQQITQQKRLNQQPLIQENNPYSFSQPLIPQLQVQQQVEKDILDKYIPQKKQAAPPNENKYILYTKRMDDIDQMKKRYTDAKQIIFDYNNPYKLAIQNRVLAHLDSHKRKQELKSLLQH